MILYHYCVGRYVITEMTLGNDKLVYRVCDQCLATLRNRVSQQNSTVFQNVVGGMEIIYMCTRILLG